MKTTAAWLGDHEVVEVHYDPEVITYAELCARARTTGCADRAFPATDAAAEIARGVFGAAEAGDHALRADREPKYYLLQSELRHLPMTELQAVRVNASMQDRPERWLTAGQLRLLARIRANPKADWPLAVGVDVRAAWDAAARVKTE